jgi:hypothetical protein
MIINALFKSYTRLTVPLSIEYVSKRGVKKGVDAAKKAVENLTKVNQNNQGNQGNAPAQQRDNAGAQLQAKGSETPVPPTELVKASPEKGISPSTSPREQPAESHKHYKIPEVKHPEPILDKSGVQQALRKANNNFDAAQEARKLAFKLNADGPASLNNTTTSTSDSSTSSGIVNENTTATAQISSTSTITFKDMPLVPSSILTQDSPSIIQAKYAIQHFIQGLKRFNNDTEFLQYWKQQVNENPGIMTRAFQVAIEITYNKRHFSARDLTKILEGEIDIVAIGDSTVVKVDSSTIYSILQTSHILNRHAFESAEVVSPPTDTTNININALSPKEQAFVQASQQATGNVVCDVKFYNHYYDYKAFGNYKFSKNHIVFIDFHDMDSRKPIAFLRNLLPMLKQYEQKSTEDRIASEYLAKAIKKLEYILNDTHSSSLEKIDEWNTYIFNTLEKRPPTLFFPLLIPTNENPITKEMLEDNVTSLKFPLKKALETFDIKKILDDIYSRMTPVQLRDAAYITRGVYDDLSTLTETN